MSDTPRLLLLSSSRTAGTEFLAHARDWLQAFLGDGARNIAFVPFAGVTIAWDDYADRVSAALEPLGYAIDPVHRATDPVESIKRCDAVMVGGGNTFQLLNELYRHAMLDPIRARVADGMPYVGWSAGSNMACPTLRTTNDMPIVQPPNFAALDLVPFQINAHYTDAMPPGHQGETRAQRLEEFLTVNPDEVVIGLPEGAALWREGDRLTLKGGPDAREFRHGSEPRALPAGSDLSPLLTLAG